MDKNEKGKNYYYSKEAEGKFRVKCKKVKRKLQLKEEYLAKIKKQYNYGSER